jgi:hypothetical protein
MRKEGKKRGGKAITKLIIILKIKKNKNNG